MTVKNISEIGSEIIRSRSKEAENLTQYRLKKIVGDLIDTMRSAGLVGMAAPQIGIDVRIFFTEIRKTKTRKDIASLDPL